MTAARGFNRQAEDDEILDHAPCACGRLAALVVIDEDGAIVCTLRCRCGAFRPVAAGEGDRP